MIPTPRPLAVGLFVTATFATATLAAPVQWRVEDGGNGHHYEWLTLGETGNTWEFARAAAAARSHAGLTGHLATVTSAAERAFVDGVANNFVSSYLGGVQARDAAAPDQGWAWITGEPWQYTDWWSNLNSPFEPTDGIGVPSPEDNAENFLSMYPAFLNHGWNDVNGLSVPSDVSGYVVEFSAIVPEPSAAALSLTTGGLALLRRRRHTRR